MSNAQHDHGKPDPEPGPNVVITVNGNQIAGDELSDELGEALDVGIAELDGGQGTESSIDEFMAEIDAAVGLTP